MRSLLWLGAVLVAVVAVSAQFDSNLVRLIIGSPSTTEEDRIIFHAHPAVPYVLTNFREGTLSLTNLDKHLLSFGVAITPLQVKTETNTSRPLASFRQVLREEQWARSSNRAALDEQALQEREEQLQRMRDERAARRDRREQLEREDEEREAEADPTPILLSAHEAMLTHQRGGEKQKRLRGRSLTARTSEESRLSRSSSSNGNNGDDQGGDVPVFLEVASQSKAAEQQRALLAAAARTTSEARDAAAAEQASVAHTFLYTPEMSISGRLALTNHIAAVGEVPQWSLYSHDDFQLSAEGWSHQDRSVCGTYGDVMLGGYCKFADVVAWRTFDALPAHKFLRLMARYHFIDNWKGEAGFAKVDNTTVWIDHHRQCDKIFSENCRGINVCGDDNYFDRLSTLIDVTIPHTNSSATLSFGSSLPGGRVNAACDASWAIDDVQLYLL